MSRTRREPIYMRADFTDYNTMKWTPDVRKQTTFSAIANDSAYSELSAETFMVNLQFDDVKTLFQKASIFSAKAPYSH